MYAIIILQLMCYFVSVFFFKQKTAYEMRMSEWSSDVCSSDLVAGVPEVIMVTPTPDGVRTPIVLAAAAVGGVDRVWAIGGAQAVGALAYGTETIASVDKIVGQGTSSVAAATRRIFGTVGLAMFTGASERQNIFDGQPPAVGDRIG